MSLPEVMMKAFSETQLRRPGMLSNALFKERQKVRIKSTLEVDTTGIEDMLGSIGIVEQVRCLGLFDLRIQYFVRIGKRLEPFYEHELDKRYAYKKNKKQ